MASSTFHARSISLPSTPNPIILDLDENLRSLSSSEASTSSSSLNLGMLTDLYDSIEGFLQLPTTQQMLMQENNRSSVDDLLNASLSFMDVCGTTNDVLSQTKQQVQEMQSTLRRKRGESDFAKKAEKYLALRKILKKAINKCLRDLKNKCLGSSSDKINDATLSTLKRVEELTFTSFESLLSTISGPKAQSRWSFVKKSSRVISEEDASEFQTVDCLLHAFVKKNAIKEDAQSELRKLELSIQDLEDELDALLRSMIRSRVFLLNILTQ